VQTFVLNFSLEYFLFCLPKKETKKGSRKTKQRVFGGVFQLSFCTTVVKISGALMTVFEGFGSFSSCFLITQKFK
jgi:hypothetical protein